MEIDVRSEVERRYREDPKFCRAALASELNVSRTTIKKHLRRIRAGIPPAPAPASACALRTIGLESLIEQERLDVRRIIAQAIESIPEGELAYEETLRRDLRISSDKWREAARDPQFEAHRATLPNRKVVWGRPRTIRELKKQDGVQ